MHIDSSIEACVNGAASDKRLVHIAIQMEVYWVSTHAESLAHMSQLNIWKVCLSLLEDKRNSWAMKFMQVNIFYDMV